MLRVKRRNTVWLGVIGVLAAVALFSTTVPPAVQATVLAILAFSVLFSVFEFAPQQSRLSKNLRRVQSRVSSQAKEARERAQRRGAYVDDSVLMLDVGLITMRSGDEGMVMRRTRSMSTDDDGVRPFITLHVDPDSADRHALVRFEILDNNGQNQYIHEMKTYLHDGEMNILADHHLPLADNPRINNMGDWDLRVYIDGTLTAMHSFTMAPSLDDRARRLDSRRAVKPNAADPKAEDVPLSLEELLRSQSRSDGKRN